MQSARAAVVDIIPATMFMQYLKPSRESRSSARAYASTRRPRREV